MSKTKISQYASTTDGANLNTDIAGINIDEGCAPSGINNAIRTLMAQVRDLQSGASGDLIPLTAGGTGAANASSARTNLGVPALTTFAGLVKSDTSGNFTAGTAGTDYVAPATPTTFTAKQTFIGDTANISSKLINALEAVTVSGSAATGTINFDITTQSVLYYTSSASGNWTLNFRASSATSLNTAMATGESVTVVFLATQGSTAYYNNAITIDGNAVTPKYQGGNAWTSGSASAIDIYSYTIIKTGSATFTVLASKVNFA
jgi:hypothetical protein